MTYRALSIYISFSAYTVLLLQTLSPFRQVTFWPVLLGTLLGLTIIARLFIPHPSTWLDGLRSARDALASRRLVCAATVPFILVLPPLLVLLIVQGWHFPPNDFDAMTYHLARAAYWRQWHSVAHFTTNNSSSVAFPGNVEVLFAAQLVLFHSARSAFLIQIGAYAMGALSIYGGSRLAGAQPPYALFAAGLFATLPEVVLQSNSTYVDITVASYITSATYFLVIALMQKRKGALVFIGLAVGLAVGAKPTSALVLPGLVVVAVFLATPLNRLWTPQTSVLNAVRARSWRKSECNGHPRYGLLLSCAVALIGALALSAPWYIENLIDFGSFTGPSSVAAAQMVSGRNAITFTVIFFRHIVGFVDPAGPFMIFPSVGSWFQGRIDGGRDWLAAVTGANLTSATIEFPGQTYSTASWPGFNMLRTWFGFGGAVTAYLSLIYCGFAVMRRRANVVGLYAAGAASYLLLTALLLRWQPWEGRLMTTMVGLGCPLAALMAQRLAAYKAGSVVLCALALYSAAGAPAAAVLNGQRPLSAWNQNYNTQQAATYAEITPMLDTTDRLVPRDAHVGIMMLGHDDWEFPFFGPDLTRTVVPIKLPISSGGTFPGTQAFSFATSFNYLIAQTPDAILGQFFAAKPSVRCVLLDRVPIYGGSPYDFFHCAHVTLQDLYAAALQAQANADFSGDLLQLDEISRAKPDFKDTQFARGWALWNLGQPDAAISAYRSYLRTHPNNVQALLNLSYSLIKQKRCNEAVPPLKKILKIQPTDVAARQDLAVCSAQ